MQKDFYSSYVNFRKVLNTSSFTAATVCSEEMRDVDCNPHSIPASNYNMYERDFNHFETSKNSTIINSNLLRMSNVLVRSKAPLMQMLLLIKGERPERPYKSMIKATLKCLLLQPFCIRSKSQQAFLKATNNCL